MLMSYLAPPGVGTVSLLVDLVPSVVTCVPRRA